MEAAKRLLAKAWKQRALFVMVLPGMAALFIFNYMPMYGVLIAFKDYNPRAGVWGSAWVGLKWFRQFFSNPLWISLLRNTFLLGLYSLIWGFPAPIVLALLFDEIRWPKIKKAMQTISYVPYFISTVIVCGMIREFSSRNGLFNQITAFFGRSPVSYLLNPQYFRSIFIGSGIWQTIGYSCIIYLAALSRVDRELLDAAEIDGANRFHKVRYIKWPTIAPTTTILLIFAVSMIMGNDFMKILLLYVPQTYVVADVIGTYTFREGLQNQRFEYTTAIGLFNAIMASILIVSANWTSKKISGNSIW